VIERVVLCLHSSIACSKCSKRKKHKEKINWSMTIHLTFQFGDEWSFLVLCSFVVWYLTLPPTFAVCIQRGFHFNLYIFKLWNICRVLNVQNILSQNILNINIYVFRIFSLALRPSAGGWLLLILRFANCTKAKHNSLIVTK
jgi:hypothetical protein